MSGTPAGAGGAAAAAAAAPAPTVDAKAANAAAPADGKQAAVSPTKLVLKERQVPLLAAPGKVNAKVSLDLGKQLKQRASRADLMKRGLLKELPEEKAGAAAAAAGAAAPAAGAAAVVSVRVDMKATGNKLSSLMAARPTKQRLQQLNVIKETPEASGTSAHFSEMKRQLEDSQRRDKLSNFLAARPKPEDISSKLVSQDDAKAKKQDRAKAEGVLSDFLTKRGGKAAALDAKIIQDIGDAEAGAVAVVNQLTPKQIDELKTLNIKHVRCGWGHTAALDEKGNLYMFGSSQNGRLGLGEPNAAKKARAALEAKKAAALKPEARAAGAAGAAPAAAAAVPARGAAAAADGIAPVMNPFGRSAVGLGGGRTILGGNRGKLMREAALAADARAKAVAEGKPLPAAPAPAAAAAAPAGAAAAAAPAPAAAADAKAEAKDTKSAPEEDVVLDEYYAKPQLVKALKALGPVEVVDLGDHHSAAIVKGVLYTWGEGSWGRLGLGHNLDTYVPTAVDLKGEKAVAVSCGSYHTLVLTATNKVFGFGWNKGGRIGLGSAQPLSVPEPAEVKVISDAKIKVVSLSAGANCSIALDSDGRAYSWGVGSFGALGHGDEKDVHEPTLIKGLSGKKITHAVFGAAHALALSQSGEIFSWGQNTSGQLGRATADAAAACSPGLIAFDSKSSTHVAAGKAHSALIKGGQLYTWGKGSNGVLGHGNENNVATPTAVAGLSAQRLTAVECGWLHSVVLTDKGGVFAFGGRELGKLGF